MQASMDVEVSVALNFVISYLYNKLPRRRVNFFGEELEKGLRQKFDGHWYPDTPTKGCAYRCIKASGDDIDPVMIWAADQSRLDLEEIKENLPRDLTIWIDPHEVSYRIGEKGTIKVLFSDKNRIKSNLMESLDDEIQFPNRGFNPEAQCFKPIDSLSSSLSSLSMSPSSPTPPGGISPTGLYTQNSITPANFLSRHKKGPAFTTASFAATKFGSTKLKTHAKRPTHLNPNDLGGFVKQRGGGLYSPQGVAPTSPQGGFLMPIRPASVSPREAPNDVLETHQQLMYMQQSLIQQQKQLQQQQMNQQLLQQHMRQQQQHPLSRQHQLITRSISHKHNMNQGLSSPASPIMADMLSCNTTPLGLGLDLSPSSLSSPAHNNTFGNLLGGSLPSPDGKATMDVSMPYSIQQLIASN